MSTLQEMRYKETTPDKTVKRIKGILKKHKIEVEENWKKKSSVNTYSLRLCNIKLNGWIYIKLWKNIMDVKSKQVKLIWLQKVLRAEDICFFIYQLFHRHHYLYGYKVTKLTNIER